MTKPDQAPEPEPASPLPWVGERGRIGFGERSETVASRPQFDRERITAHWPADATYIVHACNAYPGLVAKEEQRKQFMIALRHQVGLVEGDGVSYAKVINGLVGERDEAIRSRDAHKLARKDCQEEFGKLEAECDRLKMIPYAVGSCNTCGTTVMPIDDCPGCQRDHHRETLRLAVSMDADHDLDMQVILDREPWLFADPTS